MEYTDFPMIVRVPGANGLVRTNNSFSNDFGLCATDLSAKPVLDWIHEDDHQQFLALLAAKNGRCEARHRTKTGEYITLEWKMRDEPDLEPVILGLTPGSTVSYEIADADLVDRRETVSETLKTIALILEEQNPGFKCSILLMDETGLVVQGGAGPSLTSEYNEAVEGLRIGPTVGSCGTASYWNIPVIVEDIQNDVLWKDLKAVAEEAGVNSCWSHPFSSRDGRVLGALALYSPRVCRPNGEQMGRLRTAARMTGLAVERGRAEQALRDSREHNRTLFVESPIGLVLSRLDGGLVDVNPTYARIFGLTVEDCLADRSSTQLAWDDAERESLLNEGRWGPVEKELVNDAGQTIPVSLSGRIVETDGENFVLSSVEDISERKQAEAARLAKDAAENASQAKSTFLASMTHEIRTPLNAILGFSQILQMDKTLSATQRDQIEKILGSGRHLMNLINDTLDLSKIEAGCLELEISNFSLKDLLVDVQDMFEGEMKKKELSFEILKGEAVPEFIVSDEGKVRQVIINLLGNASKFTSRGGVLLSIEREGSILIVEVRDTGIGIPASDQSKVFEVFQQSGAAEGTGLGLPLSREISQLLGGDLTLESRFGVGSTFRLILPFRETESNDEAEEKEKLIVTGLKPGSIPPKVLVVDDVEENRVLLKYMLTEVGFEVRDADNGLSGLECFHEWKPNVVLIDLCMPIMDGYEAIREIRGHADGESTYVVAISASVLREDRQNALDSGANQFLSKPFLNGDLFDLLKSGLDIGFQYTNMTGQVL